MKAPPSENPYRILVVDDNHAIHDDFRKILVARAAPPTMSEYETELFGSPAPTLAFPNVLIESAYQGEEALAMVQRSLAEARPYAMAFMDVRMPPGWDGIETTAKVWAADPDLQIVVCTAFSDYSREEMIQKLGHSDKLLILKKPFDTVEVLQLVTALTEKWQLTLQARRHVLELEEIVNRRTEQLRKSEDRYRLITEHAGDLIAIVQNDGRWIYRSPSFQRLLGYTADELSAMKVFDLVHTEDRDTAVAAMRACTEHKGDYRVRHKNGSWLTMESHAGPFYDGNGVVEGTLFVTRDVTERRKLELQLRQAQKLESIGQLAAGIAHEINTPMQFIGDNTRFLEETFAQLTPLLKTYGELLAAADAGTLTPALIAAARSAQSAASLDYLLSEIPKAIFETLDGVKRTTKIVQAMKTFSHPGTSEKSAVVLRDAIESTLTITRNEWRNLAEVITDFDPQLSTVPLFAAEFNQVLLNLIINATHAIADVAGGSRLKGTITISTRSDGRWAEIRVQDTGTGIPQSIQHRMFEPFFTTKEPGKGTGQGLAMAHSIIADQHGGTLRFETTAGHGTTFIIRVPLSHCGDR